MKRFLKSLLYHPFSNHKMGEWSFLSPDISCTKKRVCTKPRCNYSELTIEHKLGESHLENPEKSCITVRNCTRTECDYTEQSDHNWGEWEYSWGEKNCHQEMKCINENCSAYKSRIFHEKLVSYPVPQNVMKEVREDLDYPDASVRNQALRTLARHNRPQCKRCLLHPDKQLITYDWIGFH